MTEPRPDDMSFAPYKPRTARGREVDSMLGGGDLLARAANVLLGLSLSSVTEGLPARAEAAALAEELRSAALAEPLAPWARGFVVFMVDAAELAAEANADAPEGSQLSLL